MTVRVIGQSDVTKWWSIMYNIIRYQREQSIARCQHKDIYYNHVWTMYACNIYMLVANGTILIAGDSLCCENVCPSLYVCNISRYPWFETRFYLLCIESATEMPSFRLHFCLWLCQKLSFWQLPLWLNLHCYFQNFRFIVSLFVDIALNCEADNLWSLRSIFVIRIIFSKLQTIRYPFIPCLSF